MRTIRTLSLNLFAAVLVACGGSSNQEEGAAAVDPSIVEPVERNWKAAQLLELDDIGNALRPRVAFDTDGNAIAVWQQSDGIRFNVWARRYLVGVGWQAAELIESENAGNAGDGEGPKIAFDHAGHALALWQQFDGVRYNILSNRYVPGAGWQGVQLVESDNAGLATEPELAFDGAGNAVTVWVQYDGTRHNIMSNRYTAGVGWGVAEKIELDDAGGAFSPKLSVHGSGRAVAVWYQSDGAQDRIRSNRYVPGLGWEAPQTIDIDLGGDAKYPQIAMDAGGNALAVWHQWDGAAYSIWANRYIAGIGWQVPQTIETVSGQNLLEPRIAVDTAGNGMAIWHQTDGIWSNRFVVGAGWQTAQQISANSNAVEADIAADAAGHFMAVWTDLDQKAIRARRFLAGEGWQSAQPVLSLPSVNFDSDPARVSFDPAGNALAIWPQRADQRYSIWFSWFN